jgi:serine/threonine-protein kinase
MEYVQGNDLNAWITEQPRSPEECARLILRLCDPVEHAHGKGVVHRDIKPGNVLVRAGDGLPVLCDFGLARYRSRDLSLLTDQDDILGTPAFMSPEQARGNQSQIGPPTDVHALGAVLYRMVTGRPPFQGPTPFATIEAVVRQQPTPPRQVVPAVSAGLEAVILKALAKDPRERYHTASRMKVALQQLLG